MSYTWKIKLIVDSCDQLGKGYVWFTEAILDSQFSLSVTCQSAVHSVYQSLNNWILLIYSPC